jgi:acyl-ACP thioesterase
MYSYDSRVGFSMVDSEKNITINSIIDFFQDASTFHSEDLGVGYDYLLPKNLGWVINTWQIDILRRPKYLEKVKVTTVPYKFRGFLGYRNFTLESESGEILVKANSLWSLIDIKKMKPASVPEELPAVYGSADPMEMDYQNGKIRVPESAEEKLRIKVEPHFLDPNHHMNNGQYISLGASLLPEGFKIKRLRAEYRNQAFLGDMLCLVAGQDQEGRYIVSINNAQDGKPFSVLEFS